MRDQLAPPPAEPGLHLSPRQVAQVEAALGVSVPFSSPESLVAAVERLASVGFGDIRVPFTPGQLAEIAHRAAKRGRTVDAELKAVVDRIQDELFYRAG